MTEKLVLAPAGTTDENIATFSTTTGQIQDSGTTPTGGAGKILQIVQTEKTDTFTHASTTWTQITGLTVNITPSSASNDVMIVISMCIYSSTADSTFIRLKRDSTVLDVGDAAGSRIQCTKGGITTQLAKDTDSTSIMFIDSPSTTSATTYSVDIRTSATTYVNRTATDTDSTSYCRAASNILVMEVGA